MKIMILFQLDMEMREGIFFRKSSFNISSLKILFRSSPTCEVVFGQSGGRGRGGGGGSMVGEDWEEEEEGIADE